MLDRNHANALLGAAIDTVEDLGHHHAWTLHRAQLDDGRQVFIKAADRDCGSIFPAEAAGLTWLADGEPGSPVPEVLAADTHLIALPWLNSSPPTVRAAERFGRELAHLHRRSPDTFGAPWTGWIATLPLDNTVTTAPWSRWFAQYRLQPFLRLGAQHLQPAERRLVDRVIDNIDHLAGPAEPASRIHGDLWPGNVLWTAEQALLIDPAAHGGHRETDLAMLALFGGIAHLEIILGAYEQVFPLAEGWRNRIPLHQLHNLLVHLALFGGRYREPVVVAASAALTQNSG